MAVKIKQRPEASGVWWIFINHKNKCKAKKIGKDKHTAIEAARRIEAKLTFGDFGLDDDKTQKPTIRKEYVDGWHDDNGESQIGWNEKDVVLFLKHSTYGSCRVIIDHHLIPVFGSKPINEITSRMISDLIN